MSPLITLSHGSRHPRARAGLVALTRAAAARIGVDGWDAHLEFTRPTLEEVSRELGAPGSAPGSAPAASVEPAAPAIVVPLLFTDAFHATHDVPVHVAAAAQHSPLRLARGLGMGDDLAAVLAERLATDSAADTNSTRPAHVVLYPVGTSNEGQAGRYEVLAANVAKRSARETSVVAATRGGTDRLQELAEKWGDLHVLPLFVTEALLLDKVREAIPRIEAATGARITASGPLTTDLAGIVADRYHHALEV